MEKKSEGLVGLGEILGQRVIAKRQPVLTLLDLVKKWPEIVGTYVAKQAFPNRLQQATLVVQAISPIWAQELQMMAPRLLEAIDEHCPHLNVKRLRFVS